jgi:hypothetical protein
VDAHSPATGLYALVSSSSSSYMFCCFMLCL